MHSRVMMNLKDHFTGVIFLECSHGMRTTVITGVLVSQELSCPEDESCENEDAMIDA